MNDEMRNIAKEVSHAFVGMTNAHVLSQILGIKKNEAKKYLDAFSTSFPGTLKFIKSLLTDVQRNGYAETLLGRRLKVTGLGSENTSERTTAEKATLGFVIFGSASDIVKKAMLDCLEGILRNHRDIYLILQKKYEFLFETRKRRADKYITTVSEILRRAFQLNVPLNVSIKEGINWLDMKKTCLETIEI